jgi:hypothetical protein
MTKNLEQEYVTIRGGMCMGTIFIKPPILNASLMMKHDSKSCRLYKKKHQLWIGQHGNKVSRAFLQFDLSELSPGIIIVSARLHSYIEFNEYPCCIKRLNVYQVLSKYCFKEISSRKPMLIKADPAASIQISGDSTAVSFDITCLVQNWVNGAAANLGILLRAADESCHDLIGLISKTYWDSQKWPCLEINFTEVSPPSNCCVPNSIELTEQVVSTDSWQYTQTVNILCFNYSYVAVNTGNSTAIALLQQSADGQHWQTESSPKMIKKGESVTFVSDFIVKYARLCYQSEVVGQTTTLNIYLQGRLTGN